MPQSVVAAPVVAAPVVAAPVVAAPVVAAPVVAAPVVVPPVVAQLAPFGPADLDKAWESLRASMGLAQSTMLTEVAFPLAIKEGMLQIAVKQDTWRAKVRDAVGRVDLAVVLPGIRRVEVEVAAQGQTGRERRTEAEENSRREARASAEASPLIKRLLKIFDANLENVEPVAVLPEDGLPAVEADLVDVN